MQLTNQQTATVLAALRNWQISLEGGILEVSDRFTDHFTDHAPLSTEEIDALCEALNFPVPTERAYFKSRPSDDNLSFLAWGALVPLTTQDPHSDPADPVHYCFAETEQLAISKLKSEMDQAYGNRVWIGQINETSQVILIPDDFELRLDERTIGDADVDVPYSLIEFARSQHGRDGSPVIALLYDNEAMVYAEEELADDREALIAEGWPPRFIDFLIQSAKDGYNYLRLI